MRDDCQLLRAWTEHKSEAAFGELVDRHINLVYSAALRVVGGDTHQAEDITQMVFKELAAKAQTFSSHIILAGWLYRTASFMATKAVRSEVRRRKREEGALEMTSIDQNTEPTWEQIAGQLDEALNELSPPDRDAIVLRFLKCQDFRSVGAALRISEDAAQKRVGRALEKLRLLLGKRCASNAPLTVGMLGSLLATQSMTSAPAALASTVVAGSCQAVAVGTGVGWTAMKFMTMTKLQAGLAGVLVLGGVATPLVVQRQSLGRLRDENDVLRAQVVQVTEAAKSLEKKAAASRGELEELDRLRKANTELLPLRNEVRQLREQVGMMKTTRVASAAAQRETNAAPQDRTAVQEAMKALGIAASRGDFGALDKLAEVATARVNARTNEQEYVLRDVQFAFDVLQAEGANGNDTAAQALFRAAQMKKQHLSGLAIRALGEVAAKGNEQALDMLINPERYQLMQSSTVFALREAAQNGNTRAIDALAQVAQDEKRSPLWVAVTEGLQNATIAGNPNAINAMTAIARAANKPGQRMALLALEDAAGNHPQAAEALRSLRTQ